MADVMDIAKYIIGTCEVDNLKLQKLLFYSQAVHLVLHERTPLFDDEIQAWDYGTVIPKVYDAYRDNEKGIIPAMADSENLSKESIDSIDITLDFYGKFTGLDLMKRTYAEKPWCDAYVPNKKTL